uniref:Uncharacterized protein n=1 Tax=Oryza rufipogon TaxID=4529 RepID=A0A0E0NBR8_ORYRU
MAAAPAAAMHSILYITKIKTETNKCRSKISRRAQGGGCGFVESPSACTSTRGERRINQQRAARRRPACLVSRGRCRALGPCSSRTTLQAPAAMPATRTAPRAASVREGGRRRRVLCAVAASPPPLSAPSPPARDSMKSSVSRTTSGSGQDAREPTQGGSELIKGPRSQLQTDNVTYMLF